MLAHYRLPIPLFQHHFLKIHQYPFIILGGGRRHLVQKVHCMWGVRWTTEASLITKTTTFNFISILVLFHLLHLLSFPLGWQYRKKIESAMPESVLLWLTYPWVFSICVNCVSSSREKWKSLDIVSALLLSCSELLSSAILSLLLSNKSFKNNGRNKGVMT